MRDPIAPDAAGRRIARSGRSSRLRAARGFTLVELMIVVVIIGVLAALGSFGYRKWIGRARSAEAIAMLGEMVSKEQSYKLEFASYLPLRADNKTDLPSPDEVETAFYPVFANSATFDSVWDPLESTCRHASLSIL